MREVNRGGRTVAQKMVCSRLVYSCNDLNWLIQVDIHLIEKKEIVN